MEQMEGLDHSEGSSYLSLRKHASCKPSPLTQTLHSFLQSAAAVLVQAAFPLLPRSLF